MHSNLGSAKPREAKTGYEVVMNLMAKSQGKGHMVFTNNFFTPLKLLVDLLEKGTFATGTIHIYQ